MSSSKKVLKSAFMLVGNGLAQKLIGLVSTLVLARVLLPEDFALVAIASLVIMFIEVFTITGSEQYILSKRSVSKSEVNSAWTLDIIVKGTASIVALSLAYPLSLFYENPDLTPILLALGPVPLLSGLFNPGLWRLKRQQLYTLVVAIQVASKILGVITTICIAVLTKSYWALIVGQLVTTLATCLLSYIVCSYRPSFCMQHMSKQYGFSTFMIGQELFGYLKSNIDTFFISKSYSNAEFGNFHVMKYIAVIPSLNIMLPIAEPLLVEMSKHNKDIKERAFKFTVTLMILLLIAFPISLVMFVHSEQIVRILLGEKWMDYHKILSYMGLLVTSFVVANHCKRALIIKRKTNLVFVYEILATTLVVFSVVSHLDSSIVVLVRERVYIELWAVLVFFLTTAVYYLRSAVGMFFVKVLPMLISLALLGAVYVKLSHGILLFTDSTFLFLALSLFVFLGCFLITLLMNYSIFYRHTDEGKYCLKITQKLIGSLKNKTAR